MLKNGSLILIIYLPIYAQINQISTENFNINTFIKGMNTLQL